MPRTKIRELTLKEFIVCAKLRGYADINAEAEKLPDGRSRIVYEEGLWGYVDEWRTSEDGRLFAGSELVTREDVPKWMMPYGGGLFPSALAKLSPQDWYRWLRTDYLSKLTTDIRVPIRGPAEVKNGRLKVTCRINGDLNHGNALELGYVDEGRIYRFTAGWVALD